MNKKAERLITELENTHDLKNLPNWGPYTKRYMGISHIPDVKSGMRFDFSAMPGLHRLRVEIPNVKWETGYYPTASSADLKYYAHRHYVGDSKKAFCDIEFFNHSPELTAFNCKFVNNNNWAENFSMNYFLWMNFPQMRDYNTEPVQMAKVYLPTDAAWINGMEYSKITFASEYIFENLSPDGRPHGQIRDHGFVKGEGCEIGIHDGDLLEYDFDIKKNIPNAGLLLRYRLQKSGTADISFDGIAEKSIILENNGSFAVLSLEIGAVSAGKQKLILKKRAGTPVQIDGFAVLPLNDFDKIEFQTKDWNPVPEIIHPDDNSMILKYDDLDLFYGIKWEEKSFATYCREFYCKDLDIAVRKRLNNLLLKKVTDDGSGHFANILFTPVFVEKKSFENLSGCICCGDLSKVKNILAEFSFEDKKIKDYSAKLAKTSIRLKCVEDGRKYLYSQNYISNLLMTQIVYPVNTAGTVIRHSPPGRWWDCLYTWDSGFIGIAFADLDINRAIWNLNAYLSSPEESYAAFIHHGTPLPVQHYLMLEIWNRTHDEELLRFFYPGLRRFYLFLAGRYKGSVTRDMKSGLIRTWDYFINTGGWDDYPPQEYVIKHDRELTKALAPAVSTAHLIRAAKILKRFAEKIGESSDDYDKDIKTFSDALQKYSWDKESGYFSYVLHDEKGNPKGIFRHSSGENFNMGMDGVSPLVSGICTPEQEKVLVANLMDENKMWSPVGISTVDRRASYYSDSGYWNGAVWMPHQWFFWKALLDIGRNEEAFKIAHTALETWQTETMRTNSSFEHFAIKSGRGAGWHHFTGLSCPVINWFAAYFREGTFTGGFDLFVEHIVWRNSNTCLTATLDNKSERRGNSVCIAVMSSMKKRYSVMINGKKTEFIERQPGLLEISIPAGKIILEILP